MNQLIKAFALSVLVTSTSLATVVTCESGQVVTWDPYFNQTLVNVQDYVFRNLNLTNTPAITGQTGNYCPSYRGHGGIYADGQLDMWRASTDWENPLASPGGYFTLHGFDLAKQRNFDDFGAQYTFTVFVGGTQSDGNVLERTITFPRGDSYFEHFTFTGWTDLTELALYGDLIAGPGDFYGADFVADNIDVTETPEPATIVLLGVGILSLWMGKKWWCARHDSNMRPFGS